MTADTPLLPNHPVTLALTLQSDQIPVPVVSGDFEVIMYSDKGRPAFYHLYYACAY